jgi:hypothetical protein
MTMSRGAPTGLARGPRWREINEPLLALRLMTTSGEEVEDYERDVAKILYRFVDDAGAWLVDRNLNRVPIQRASAPAGANLFKICGEPARKALAKALTGGRLPPCRLRKSRVELGIPPHGAFRSALSPILR